MLCHSPFSVLLMALAFSLVGCGSQPPIKGRVPITAAPTQPIVKSLLGDWLSMNRGSGAFDSRPRLWLKIRSFDENNYIIAINDKLFHAYHSDVEQIPFLSVHDIESAERSYTYMTWRSETTGEGQPRLSLHVVDNIHAYTSLGDSTRLYNELRQFETDKALQGELIELLRVRGVPENVEMGGNVDVAVPAGSSATPVK